MQSSWGVAPAREFQELPQAILILQPWSKACWEYSLLIIKARFCNAFFLTLQSKQVFPVENFCPLVE